MSGGEQNQTGLKKSTMQSLLAGGAKQQAQWAILCLNSEASLCGSPATQEHPQAVAVAFAVVALIALVAKRGLLKSQSAQKHTTKLDL